MSSEAQSGTPQQRKLRAAGSAPRRPFVDHHRVPPQGTQLCGERVAVGVDQGVRAPVQGGEPGRGSFDARYSGRSASALAAAASAAARSDRERQASRRRGKRHGPLTSRRGYNAERARACAGLHERRVAHRQHRTCVTYPAPDLAVRGVYMRCAHVPGVRAGPRHGPRAALGDVSGSGCRSVRVGVL